ncbi:asparagine synthase (glutamine-hydrolyzing) [Trichlorobacter lovleyi]|uniref:asparagine synthase (glutamine-hydrolyzing) n=1 Tax=Trichlorobacter lovleyi (strain ATCC BAA-1151 / DSM 17278 / SZ) TaxID=398767 RepID=B3E8V0_TRIL1|nr:asparagine synthase (glutamine-hydrolyzing) [Trichlorobacter lovleyi]ACD95218.1 asparagine synthase (glutamine-hydrolyzing) [Trichlorobacter lovleyi SZ]
MCGIAGIVYRNKKSNHSEQIAEMLKLIHHRGPDGMGVFEAENVVLGHRRLAIIDLSPSGHQPMCYLDRFIITFNGEIYNYLELKEELSNKGYYFISTSDTEVILAAYAEWGEDCVTHLNGMFAFGLYDLLERTLFLARDRVGEKPLYYSKNENEFFFFSEPKQVISSGIIEGIPNEVAIRQYLEYQFTLSAQTFFTGIYKLLPGHCATLRNGVFKSREYWSLADVEVDYSISYAEAKLRIKNLVEDSLKIRLRSDVPVASYLSGGIDSTIIATSAAKELSSLSTYTFTSKKYPRFDESQNARLTADLIHADHHEIEIENADTLSLWQNSTYFMDEPEVGYSLLSQMAVSREVAKQTKVVLGGQGGDELFFGYAWYSNLLLKSFLSFSSVADFKLLDKVKVVISFLLNSPKRTALRLIFDSFKSFGRPLSEIYIDTWRGYGCFSLLQDIKIKEGANSPVSGCLKLSELKKFEFNYWLHGLLHVEDRSSMAHSLESRVPLLDHRLVEFVFSLPPHFMIDGVLNKKIFIDAFSDILPNHVKNNKQKMGYVSPIHSWLSDQHVTAFIKDVISNKSSFIYHFVDYYKMKSLQINDRQLWMLISLEIWHNIFIKRDIKSC